MGTITQNNTCMIIEYNFPSKLEHLLFVYEAYFLYKLEQLLLRDTSFSLSSIVGRFQGKQTRIFHLHVNSTAMIPQQAILKAII